MALRAVWRSVLFSFYHLLFLLLVSFRSRHQGGLEAPEKYPVGHESRRVTLVSPVCRLTSTRDVPWALAELGVTSSAEHKTLSEALSRSSSHSKVACESLERPPHRSEMCFQPRPPANKGNNPHPDASLCVNWH